jgi:hypothetical protein
MIYNLCLILFVRSLADRNQDLRLDAREYAIAMFLIRQKQANALLPSALPKNLIYSVYPEERPSSFAPSSGTTTPNPLNKSRSSSGNFTGNFPLTTLTGALTPSSPIADYKTIPQVFGSNGNLIQYKHLIL